MAFLYNYHAPELLAAGSTDENWTNVWNSYYMGSNRNVSSPVPSAVLSAPRISQYHSDNQEYVWLEQESNLLNPYVCTIANWSAMRTPNPLPVDQCPGGLGKPAKKLLPVPIRELLGPYKDIFPTIPNFRQKNYARIFLPVCQPS